MPKQNREHLKVDSLSGINLDDRIEAIKIIAELEEIQGVNDDIIEYITKQNDAIEVVIQKLIKSGVYKA